MNGKMKKLRIKMNTGENYEKILKEGELPFAEFDLCDKMGVMFNITRTFMINPNFVKTIQVID